MEPVIIILGILGAFIILANPYLGLLATISLFSFPLLSISHNLFLGTPIKIIGAVTFLSTLLHNILQRRKLNLLKIKSFRLFLLFLAYIYVLGFIKLGPFTKVNFVIFASFAAYGLIILSLVSTKRRFLLVIWTSLISLFIACSDAIIFYLSHPGLILRLEGPFLDPNYFAIALLPHIGLCYFLINAQKNTILRIFLMVIFAVLIIALVLTSSRGGLIGFAVMFISAILKSKSKFGAIISVIFLSIIMLNFMPEQVWERFDATKTTISNFERTSKVESTKRRIILAQSAWKMYLDNPIFGTGIGNFYYGHRQYSFLHAGRAHTMYLELMAELGTIGFLMFLGLLASTFKTLKLITKSNSDLSPYAKGLSVGLVGFLVAAIFLHAQQEKVFWLCIFLTIALEQIHRNQFINNKKEKPKSKGDARLKWKT